MWPRCSVNDNEVKKQILELYSGTQDQDQEQDTQSW